jgi:hypothetical protein
MKSEIPLPMIATDNLTKQFGSVNAVENLSIEIPEERFGFWDQTVLEKLPQYACSPA